MPMGGDIGQNPAVPTADQRYTCIEKAAVVGSMILFVVTFPFSLFFCYKVVAEFERVVLLRMGKLRRNKSKIAGAFFVLPCIDEFIKVDLRTQSFNIPPQEVMTRDSVTVNVDAVVFYRVKDPIRAICSVARYGETTRLLGATTLRNIIGQQTLSSLLSDRDIIAVKMQEIIDAATEPWGVIVERVEIKEVALPPELKRAMATEAEAMRGARAIVIAAEGEKDASMALREASRVLCESPGALQLRYLQTLTTIAAEKNSTVIFPLPMDILRAFGKN